MIKKIKFTDIRLEDDEMVIRRIVSDDFSSFCDYTRAEYFEDTLKADDTLGIFIDKEMVGAILSHDKGEDLHKDKTGTSLGYSCKKSRRNQGIMSRALRLLSDYLLEDIDFIQLQISKDNYPSIKAAANAGFKEVMVKDEYLIYEKNGER